MIITRAPYRISFFGGGSDYHEWFKDNHGAVLSVTIDKFCWVTARYLPDFWPDRNRVVWAVMEEPRTIDGIRNPIVKHALKHYNFAGSPKVEIRHAGDLPARSGMGSSSAFSTALLLALQLLRGQARDSEKTLAARAIHLERTLMQEKGGWQDQIACSYGGLNYIEFKGTDFEVSKVRLIYTSRLQEDLMLFYTGTVGDSKEITEKIAKCANPDIQREQAKYARIGLRHLMAGEFYEFGMLLDDAWRSKRKMAPGISNDRLNEIYRRAVFAGAIGGKLLGAGGRGFFLFYVPELYQKSVRRELSDLTEVPFKFYERGAEVVYA